MRNKKSSRKKQKPEIFAVSKKSRGVSRRDFVALGSALTGAAIAGGMSSCSDPASSQEKQKQTSSEMDCRRKIQRSHTDAVRSVTFNPAGTLLASGSLDKSIKLWNMPEGALLRTLSGHTLGINSVAFNASGTVLASGSSDRSIKLWGVPDGSLLATLAQHSGSISSIAFNPDATLLASGSSDISVILWSLASNTVLKTLTGHSGEITSVAISPDGKMLASASEDRTIKLWQLPEGTLLKTLTGHSFGVTCAAFSPDGKILASGSIDGTINLWGLPDGNLLDTMYNSSRINSLAFSYSGIYLAFANSYNIQLYLFSETAYVGNNMNDNYTTINSVTFNPVGTILASGNEKGMVVLWDQLTQTTKSVLSDPANILEVVCYSGDYYGYVCTCDTVDVCTCDTICTCNTICISDSSSSCGYWYPN